MLDNTTLLILVFILGTVMERRWEVTIVVERLIINLFKRRKKEQ